MKNSGQILHSLPPPPSLLPLIYLIDFLFTNVLIIQRLHSQIILKKFAEYRLTIMLTSLTGTSRSVTTVTDILLLTR